MEPRKIFSLTSGMATLNRVTQMQYTEKTIFSRRTMVLGTPSQTRTLDSRSYFFMTSSTSAAVPTSTSGSMVFLSFTSIASPFSKNSSLVSFNCGTRAAPPKS